MTEVERRLLLLRHAKSERPAGSDDHDRPLAPRGRRDAAAVGHRLVEQSLVPDLVLCSDAVRAVETWQAASAALPHPPPVRLEPALYEASPASVVSLLAELPDDARTVLVVGHEPTTSEVAAALAGPGSAQRLVGQVRAHLPTSGFVVLEHDGPWSGLGRGTCRLTDLSVSRG